MMTLIIESLNKIFNQENYRTVFWEDPEKEFESEIDLFQIDEVKLVRLDQVGHLALKIQIEIDEPDSKFLLYSPTEKPDIEEDFLLDMRYFSYNFHANRSSILLNELGLANQHLVNYLKLRTKFFDSKERINNLKKIVNSGDTEIDLDRKMLAVVTKSSQDGFYSIVRSIFQSYTEQDNSLFETPSDTWKLIEKFGLNDTFWKLSEEFFTFKDETPTLQKLLIQLFVTDFVHRINDPIPSKLKELRLPNKNGEHNTVTFFDQWRDSNSQADSYNKLAEYAAETLSINETLEKLPLDSLLKHVTFSQVDDQILEKLLEELFKYFNIDTDKNYSGTGFFRTTALNRQQKHWIHSPSVAKEKRNKQYAAYELIALAAEIIELSHQYSNGFNIDTVADMFRLYTNELYKFDQLYRRFHRNADLFNFDQVKNISEEVDNIYQNKYLIPLSLKWNRFLENGLLKDWKISGISNQYEFYNRFVAKEAEEHRVFVIISDAFRYSAAEELKNTLNGRDRFHAELSAMLGVVPSYTALGMAALLPHDQLTYNKEDILADGHSTAGLENRNAILAKSNGIAVQADKLLAMKRDEIRKLIDNKIRVVYIYHNGIDSHGDSSLTEKETFQATDNTIEELAKLAKHISNDLSGSYIIVTSDHGFVYTNFYPTETNRSKNKSKTDNIIIAKKRYFIGHNLTQNNDAWFGNTEQTAKCNSIEFGTAKGYNIFNFSSSKRYFHGGAMLQEIVIPVVVIRPSRNKKDIAKTKIKNVSISILGNRFKITTAKHRFQFIQTEQVSDRIRPVTVKLAIYDTNNQLVSSIETLTFNSTSENIDERKQSAYLTLQSHSCNKSEKYYLIMRCLNSNVEILNQEITIDRAIAEDFN